MNRLIIVITFVLVSFQYSFGQFYGRPGDWKKYRHEYFVSMGSSHFLGDLGGRDRVGTDFSPADLDFGMTRTAMGLGYRYRIQKWFNASSTFNWLLLKGDDAFTNETYRNNRNLNFRNNVLELSARAEFGYFQSKLSNRYSIKKSLSSKRYKINWNYFAYTGIAVLYHNPKGRDASGNYVKLKPLHTEGQGLPGGPKQYKNIAVAIPFGVYIKGVINRTWCVGLDICYRKTFTDYLDDVSTSYYDKTALLNAYGPKSVEMSDPNKGLIYGFSSPAADGTRAQRGDNNKDTYISAQVTFGYIMKAKKKKKARLRSKF
jgi:hypothetical protein